MTLHDYPYILTTLPDGSLEDRIEYFYTTNNKLEILAHVRAVADTNVRIARQFHLDEEKCFLAGLLHDVSGVMRPEDMRAYAKACGLWQDEAEEKYPFLLHQRLSRIFAETLFDIRDPDILSAVECHSTCKACPGPYDLSLFIADKLSSDWDQGGRPPFFETVSNALTLSLESAALSYINYALENKMILCPHRWLLDAKIDLEKSVKS